MRLLVRLFSLVVMFSMPSFGREPITGFHVGEAEAPAIVSKGSGLRSAANITIHETPAPTKPTKKAEEVWVSVYDPKPLSKKEVGECSEARRCNRILIIHATETKKIMVKVCRGGICSYEPRDTEELPIRSTTLLHYLAQDDWKDGKWKVGDDECSHFKLVNFNDKANTSLMKELGIKWDDLPILVKEGDTERRKRAHGMKGNDVANIWNKWFVEPEADLPQTTTVSVSKCVPGVVGANGLPQWDYYGKGTLRDHLVDPTAPHRLPKVLVDGWSDAQVQAFHNLHHESMRKQNQQRVHTQPQKRPISTLIQGGRLQQRIAQIAQSEIRPMPSLGKPGDSVKKLHPLNESGDVTSGIGFVKQFANKYLQSINRSMVS